MFKCQWTMHNNEKRLIAISQPSDSSEFVQCESPFFKDDLYKFLLKFAMALNISSINLNIH